MPTVMSPVLVDVHALHAAAGGDGEVALADVAGALEVAGEDAHAVAAHLGDGAVAVAVVHEPLGLGGQVPRLGVGGGAHDVQQAVAADAGPPVAQRRDGGRGQLEGVLRVGDDHEVVLGAVPLEEGDPRGSFLDRTRWRPTTHRTPGRGPAQPDRTEWHSAQAGDAPDGEDGDGGDHDRVRATTRQSGRRPDPRAGQPGPGVADAARGHHAPARGAAADQQPEHGDDGAAVAELEGEREGEHQGADRGERSRWARAATCAGGAAGAARPRPRAPPACDASSSAVGAVGDHTGPGSRPVRQGSAASPPGAVSRGPASIATRPPTSDSTGRSMLDDGTLPGAAMTAGASRCHHVIRL